MSAIAAYCWPDVGITVVSDGVAYGDDGKIQGFVSKILPLQELNCFIGNVGAGGFAGYVRDRLVTSCRNFDDVVTKLAEEVAAVHLAYDLHRYSTTPHATVICGGWSDRDQCFALYKIGTRTREMINQATGEKTLTTPGEPVKMDGLWCSTSPSDEAMKRFGLDALPASIAANEILSRYVCACRADGSQEGKGDFEGLPYYVGGFLQLTEFRRDQLTMSVIHRWPDEVGKIVDPAAGEPMPQFPIVGG